MEKSFIFKYRKIIYFFICSMIAGILLCGLFLRQYTFEWKNVLVDMLKNMFYYMSNKEITKKIVVKNVITITVIAIVLHSVYRRFLKYFMSILYGFAFGFIPSVVAFEGSGRLSLALVVVIMIHAGLFAFATYVMYIKKYAGKYIIPAMVVAILTYVESIFYCKIVARIIMT